MECMGYGRFPVFVVRTPKGYVKRQPFEEIKPEPTPAVVTVWSPDIEAVQVVSWFWGSFVRSSPSKYALQCPSHWLEHFLFLPSPLPALKEAVLAVSLARWSKVVNHDDAFETGRSLYTKSLGSMQIALANRRTRGHNDLLAATCVLALYELFDPTGGNSAAWMSHLQGVYRLLEYRGPSMHTNAASRSIFEHSRYMLMVQHLMSRKACVLGQPEWITEPWNDAEKSVEQQVFDNGLRLAGAFEACDTIRSYDYDSADIQATFQECVDIYNSIVRLVDVISPAIAPDLENAPRDDSGRLIIRDSAALMLSITALAIKLGACDTACALLSRPHAKLNFMPVGAHCLFDDIQPTAFRIIDLVSACVSQKVGGMGAARLIFALKLARPQLAANSSELQKCNELINRLRGLDRQLGALGSSCPPKILSGMAEISLVQSNSMAVARRWQILDF